MPQTGMRLVLLLGRGSQNAVYATVLEIVSCQFCSSVVWLGLGQPKTAHKQLSSIEDIQPGCCSTSTAIRAGGMEVLRLEQLGPESKNGTGYPVKSHQLSHSPPLVCVLPTPLAESACICM